MYMQFALAALLALTGLAYPAGTASEDAGSAQAVRGVTTNALAAAASGVKTAEGSDAEPIAQADIPIVVPPVDEAVAGAADATIPAVEPLPLEVVADELSAPGRVTSEVVDATGFQTVGVTWPEGAAVADLEGQVRTSTDGVWSPWLDLEPGDIAPDAGTADARNAVRGGTDPLAIGDVDAVQLSFAATPEGGPDGMKFALIGSNATTTTTAGSVVGSAATSTASIRNASYSTGVATAAGAAPAVYSRADWGAPAQICTPDVASTLVGAVVHHTAGSNAYSTVAQAMQQIRNDAQYHISSRGWCDIGYNFVVDKWGNIYEGRANSLTQPVIGVHTGGFNTATVGVAMLGTFDAAPSAATQSAVARIIGWRLGAYGVDPQSTMTYRTGAGENSRYTNQDVVLPRVFGHRDTAYTACPGQGGWNALPSIRAMARDAAASNSQSIGAQPVESPGTFRAGFFRLRASYSSGNADGWFTFGNPGDSAVMGDWNGDGTKTPGVFRNGVWYLRNSNSPGGADIAFAFGSPGDVPVVGDWNNDGVETIGVFRAGMWYVRNSNTSGAGEGNFRYGQAGDEPVVGDWNNDGTDTLGVFRGGFWYLTNFFDRGYADGVFGFGSRGDQPVAGDWNRDGTDTLGVFRNGMWYLSNFFDHGTAEGSFSFGGSGDKALLFR
ncbi:peptidoglycan recognition protein family protein [Pengzhenrongella sicca]|uniref:N-acetylmuramoyl-L-alanine amidase n=1 Tax=Pengzhenrongella sicca TaxID=2819238 RepID=A0A8A4ZIA0_9MICO|nr:N-acetylmuramoyl-L-alanine amidase [Pengzhenrongella sicca]QTE30247.1 N-acetylmuramoyl-L-alanine amidase [Pengzhenrongella sicca]